MNDCIFCQIINKTLPSSPIYEDDSVIVIQDIHPQAPVHLLVIPKTHSEEFIQADDATVHHMVSLAKQLIVNKHITSYRVVNNGKGAAVVDHFHLHILGNIDRFRTL